jgi:hypothetical protein
MALPAIYAVAGLAELGIGAYNTYQQGQRAKTARADYQKRLSDWRSQDTSNLYANMENTYEDLTVNTQAADYQRQMQQQQSANMMAGLSGAAGGSGIAAFAQSLANQQADSQQRIAASIGSQEQSNQQLAAGQAGRLQMIERQGAEQSRGLKAGMLSTELGMSMNELSAANEARRESISQAIGGATTLAAYGLSTDKGKELMGGVGDFFSGGGQSSMSGPLANLTESTVEPLTQTYDPNAGDKILEKGGNFLDYRSLAEQTVALNMMDYYNNRSSTAAINTSSNG